MNLLDIVTHLNAKGLEAKLDGDETEIVRQVSGLAEARKGDLSFLSDSKRISELEETQASAVLVKASDADKTTANKIIVENPYACYAVVAQRLNDVGIVPGTHPSSVISETAHIPKTCQIDANVTIGEDVVLGEYCVIGAGSVLGKGVVLGDHVRLYPNVTIMDFCQAGDDVTIESGTVIGGQGFGFANHRGQWLRIPQIGRVMIGKGCWIGNNCAIDRGAINDTEIGDNCILDNLVHIAHNVKIGEGTAIAGQVGFAGSSAIGKHCTFAGQVGVAGHIEVADQSHFAAKAGVTHSIKASGSYSGFPAVETPDWQKSMIRLKNIDKMAKQIKRLEKELEELKTQLED
ncbi:MAG: UDP-3-O-(3-hydroxymyristoyl)glucosamine N-acyltransferase [Hydrogenovibrio sp.]|nr:UDP-3-O-(3-hydroxymyristoyl)glucosamine N-acyltransferase [Hydrogenovibrio sp.]